jgi:hypothetical protein
MRHFQTHAWVVALFDATVVLLQPIVEVGVTAVDDVTTYYYSWSYVIESGKEKARGQRK